MQYDYETDMIYETEKPVAEVKKAEEIFNPWGKKPAGVEKPEPVKTRAGMSDEEKDELDEKVELLTEEANNKELSAFRRDRADRACRALIAESQGGDRLVSGSKEMDDISYGGIDKTGTEGFGHMEPPGGANRGMNYKPGDFRRGKAGGGK